MKKIFKALKFSILFILFLSSFIACDKDFSTVKSDVVGENNTNFLTDSIELPIAVSNRKLDAVQINNLPSYLLGVFNDEDYGKSTASIVSQLTPNANSLNEDFGENPTINSVIINIPYFSVVTGTDLNDSNRSTYKVDSLYSNDPEATFKLSIYQNNFFLRDFDPSGTGNGIQAYYSKAEQLDNPNHNFALNGSQQIDFDNHLGALIYEKSDFKINTNGFVVEDMSDPADPVTTFLPPALRITLNNQDEVAFWEQLLFEMTEDEANNFKEYFRGLYFKAESDNDNGNMVLMNLASANASVTINYEKGLETERINDAYVLNFSGNILNTFKNEFDTPLTSGDDKLYLKGLEGSMAVIDLFPTEEDLQRFLDMFRDENKNQKALITEARLTIYEDETLFNDTDDNGDEYHKHDRIYAYDVKNNIPLIDYRIDPTTSNSDALNSKGFSLGQRSESGKYVLRITDHLNNIIQNDSLNTKIGLVLSTNVNLTSSTQVLNNDGSDITGVPSVSVISPRGTILKGSDPSIGEKRLKLEVFFIEPK